MGTFLLVDRAALEQALGVRDFYFKILFCLIFRGRVSGHLADPRKPSNRV